MCIRSFRLRKLAYILWFSILQKILSVPTTLYAPDLRTLLGCQYGTIPVHDKIKQMNIVAVIEVYSHPTLVTISMHVSNAFAKFAHRNQLIM